MILGTGQTYGNEPPTPAGDTGVRRPPTSLLPHESRKSRTLLGVSQSRVLTALLSFAASLAVVGALIVSTGTTAQAGSSLLCSGYSSCKRAGYDHFGYETKQKTSYWRMYTGTNCTNYVAYRLVTTNGMPNVRPKSGVGNARDWGTAMASVTDKTPTVGSVAWWGKTGNHVAYVEKVASPTEIIVSESNWGRTFDHRRITQSGSGWPDGFIHFADPGMTNTALPTLKGRGRVGEPLTATAGSWSPAATSLRYEWRVDGTVKSTTGTTYTPVEADFGKDVTVRVTASRPSSPAARATSSPVTVSRGYLTPVSTPSVSGTPVVGGTLTATLPTWSPAAESVTYTWTADGEPVAGATGSRLSVGPDLVGRRLAATAVGRRTAHVLATSSSDPTDAVRPGVLTSTTAPSIVGSPAVGAPLTIAQGTWNSSDLDLDVAWLVDDVVVPGATGTTWSPRAQDVGRTVSARVTLSSDGYTSTSRTVRAGTPVAPGEFAPWPRATLPRDAEVGTPLVAKVPTSVPTPALTYQWYVDGVLVPGATTSTFTPRAADAGSPVRVFVTARHDGVRTLRLASVPTSPVTRPVIRASAPKVTGAPRPLTTVGTDIGTVTPAGTTAYQWFVDGRAVKGATRSTYAVPTADIGRDLAVRVVHRAPGRTSLVLMSEAVPVKAQPTVRLTIEPKDATVGLTVAVTARGSSPVPGRITLAFGSTRRTIALSGGRASVVLDRPSTPSTLTVSYTGSPRVESRRVTRSVP